MAELLTDIKVISKRNEGFPEWLDFDKMRKEGIEYIAQLSGKIWTDHNVHDPGITILEMLCYALLDLGYRTSLPAKDLFAKDPDDLTSENNFFTPAQILGCNPLTITDYRRLLVDIPGVKNAWLSVAEDITVQKICGLDRFPPTNYPRISSCINFLNGLYHVYLDLEGEPNDADKKKIVEEVKKSLMAHRNLCEDFYDITILCKQKIGVCADVELDPSADSNKVFLQLIETLRDFFSPSPKFYRLRQLVEEKGRSIEEVFAGRPFDLTQSHGFVDIEEFEKIELRREIHLSDIYNTIFSIPGISSIRNLTLQNCDGTRCQDRNMPAWIFKIYENHVPDFSLDCSGFQFTQNGGTVIVDKKKFSEYLKLNFTNSGKTLSDPPSASLDYLLEQGNFRKDLAEYYPIENEFPKVYGIAKGSLPDDVTALRKSQSLQLRSYLLFFDHFLSGYLSQLKNIRNLFSFSSTKEKNSYYINKLTDWPDLEQLVSFSLLEENSHGNVIATPVRKSDLDALILNGRIDHCEVENILPAYLFSSKAERDTAIHQVIEDLNYGTFSGYVIPNKNDCWFYYFYGSSDKFAVVGKGPYKTEADAQKALEALRFACTDETSYRSYSTNNNTKYSFDVANSVAGYWNFLQLMVEDEKLYLERRNGFLDHLLARFAETFTDYALLSYSSLQGNELQKNLIEKKERFLSNYPELSSTRGKAYDYQLDGWNNNNVSGVEKRFEAYTGIGSGSSMLKNWSQQNLCHFEVLELPEQTVVNISWKDKSIFTSEKSFESREEGKQALLSLLTALTRRESYKTSFAQQQGKYTISVDAADTNFIYARRFETEADAKAAIPQLQRMFSLTPLQEDILPSQFQHTLFLRRKYDNNRWVRKQPVINREAFLTISPDLVSDFKDVESWMADSGDIDRASVSFQSNPAQPLELININAFEPYINRVDVKKQSTIYKYAVNDPQKSFFIISNEEFGSENEAREQMLRMLFLLTDASNLYTEDTSTKEARIHVRGKDGAIASNTIEFANRDEAEHFIPRIVDYVIQQVFNLKVDSTPINWRYQLRLGLPGTKIYDFTSRAEYNSPGEASQKAEEVAAGPGNFDVHAGKNNELELKDEKHPRTVEASYALKEGENLEEAKMEAKDLLSLKKSLHRVLLNPNAPEAEIMVMPDRVSRYGNFAYRLVKKDGYHAIHDLDGDFSSQASKEQLIKYVYSVYQHGHEYLQICYGGDHIIQARVAASGVTWYHYLIKAIGHGNEVALFESVKGYSSSEEAEKAFELEHVHILTAASDPNNYGTLISFDENFLHEQDSCCSSIKFQVFVPKKTMDRFGQNHDQAKQGLSLMAATYPIRSIKNTSQLFADLFLCGDKIDEPDACCEECAKTEKYYYYFVYKSPHDKLGGWRSYRYFESARQALSAFRFFIVLLHYKGNYYINYGDCDCKWFLYLREILAISKRRFPTANAAWGREGVMKFICTSQSKDAFPAYLKDDGCCYSFHVACGNLGLIHPCTYDSPQHRDRALRRLYNASRHLYENIEKLNWIDIWDEIENSVFGRPSGNKSSCDEVLRNIKMLLERDLVERPGLDIEKIRWFAHYFPVVKRKLGLPGEVYRYYLEIKLPEFCKENLGTIEPCGCNGKDKELHCCCTAWESECCFETCEEALKYYYKVAKCLASIDNYYTVFDCECGPYGIRFHCDCEEEEKKPQSEHEELNPFGAAGPTHPGEVDKKEHDHCCSEIVAVNPQCYTSPKMVCEAIERAKRLINAEGLHLVEHILLRPHCENGDCECPIPVCDTETPCDEFEWVLPDDDPCEKGKKYCFVPGRDPYSFIATAILPAWPERYRRRENRQLVEQLLYREMPAHIMLRILWLTPKDLCHFESIYRNWTRWLAHKEICVDYSPPCRLIDFLFDHEFECFDCEECLPCEVDSTVPDHCNFNRKEVYNPNRYVNAINRLFCWESICPLRVSLSQTISQLRSLRKVVPAQEPQTLVNEDAERIIDQRFHRYRDEVKVVADLSGNMNAGMAWSFLNNPSPDFSNYIQLIDSIIANKKSPENIKLLSTEQKAKLISSITSYYLDRLVLDDKLSPLKADLGELFRKLESWQLLPAYKDWKGSELNNIRQTTDINDVKKLLKKRS